jgi:hypothetical protein
MQTTFTDEAAVRVDVLIDHKCICEAFGKDKLLSHIETCSVRAFIGCLYQLLSRRIIEHKVHQVGRPRCAIKRIPNANA